MERTFVKRIEEFPVSVFPKVVQSSEITQLITRNIIENLVKNFNEEEI